MLAVSQQYQVLVTVPPGSYFYYSPGIFHQGLEIEVETTLSWAGPANSTRKGQVQPAVTGWEPGDSLGGGIQQFTQV